MTVKLNQIDDGPGQVILPKKTGETPSLEEQFQMAISAFFEESIRLHERIVKLEKRMEELEKWKKQ